jgi:hypothetical protein
VPCAHNLVLKQEKEVLKQEKDVLKQKKYVPKQDAEEKSEKKSHFFNTFFHFCPAGRPGTGRDRLSKSRPVPWQDFELVPLSLCPGTRKELLSLCPEKLHCPVPLETLL